MNGRNKYAEQFDRNAGEPADFDSLFRFEKGELITKKRIKMRSSRRRIAAMTITAAAVTAAAVFGLSYLNSSGTSDISIAELAVDGKQLIACGMKPGRELGVMLHELLERVLDEPSLNTKEQLLKIVSDKLNNK